MKTYWLIGRDDNPRRAAKCPFQQLMEQERKEHHLHDLDEPSEVPGHRSVYSPVSFEDLNVDPHKLSPVITPFQSPSHTAGGGGGGGDESRRGSRASILKQAVGTLRGPEGGTSPPPPSVQGKVLTKPTQAVPPQQPEVVIDTPSHTQQQAQNSNNKTEARESERSKRGEVQQKRVVVVVGGGREKEQKKGDGEKEGRFINHVHVKPGNGTNTDQNHANSQHNSSSSLQPLKPTPTATHTLQQDSGSGKESASKINAAISALQSQKEHTHFRPITDSQATVNHVHNTTTPHNSNSVPSVVNNNDKDHVLYSITASDAPEPCSPVKGRLFCGSGGDKGGAKVSSPGSARGESEVRKDGRTKKPKSKTCSLL
jgi:hypothetical protein